MQQTRYPWRWRVGVVVIIIGSLLIWLVLSAREKEAYTVVRPATLLVGDPIPLPERPVVLTLHGLINNPNQHQQLDLSMETLEQFGMIEYTLRDPYLNRTVTYQGVLFKTLLLMAGVPDTATHVTVTALDAYQVTIPLAELRSMPVMLATRRDGEPLSPAEKGPLEIVYPYHQYALDHDTYASRWVWQVRSLEIR